MSNSSGDRTPVERLAEEFLECHRRGERPSPTEYADLHPECAEEIRELFPALMLMERLKPATGDVTGSFLEGGHELERHIPERVGDFRILREAGRGGMGIVFEAHQISLNRVVALKVIRSDSFASEAEQLRFQNEAEAVAHLDHPQIVPVYEVGSRRGRHFFSMKLISGGSLDARLEEFAQDPKRSAKLVAMVAEAIHHAHQRGILHRDLKPANILLDEQGAPHVTDFGLAKRLDGDVEITRTDILVGTPSYMAPEQASRGRVAVSTATDVYGLG
ncbi:serine/threonine-protein kinase, partial [Singulisphaera rosea]